MKKLVGFAVGVLALMALADPEAKPIKERVFSVDEPKPVVFGDMTNIVQKVQILWAEHTNRVNRIEQMREKRRRTMNENGRPPVKPFKVKGGKK